MLGVLVAGVSSLYVYFHAEMQHLAHHAWHHWRPLRRALARMPVATEMAIAVLGGLAVVAVVHLREPFREKKRARRAGRLSAAVRGGRRAPRFAAPAPHFGDGPRQCGAPGTHAAHDARSDPVRRPRPSDVERFERDGYLVVRSLLDAAEVAELRAEMDRIVEAWPEGGTSAPGDAPETPLVAFDPAFLDGTLRPRRRVDGIRRLFRMAVHDAFFAAFAKDGRFVDFLKALWGPDVALLQSMALMKPPGSGEKRFHQDQAYFRLAPSHVAAYWIAVDATDAENGCMHVVPGSHVRGVDPHGADVGLPPDDPEYRKRNLGGVYYSRLGAAPKRDDVLAVPMGPGDALVFHGDLVHATPPNRSKDRPRFAVQLHYAAANCRPIRCPDGPNSVKAPNATYGPAAAAFDCAPEPGRPCVEPQFWFYRQAELIAAGERHPGGI